MRAPREGRRAYPVLALGLLSALAALPAYAFLVLGPDIARALGVGVGTIAALALVQALVVPVAALALAASVRERPRRALLSVGGAAAWSLAALATAVVTRPLGLAAALLASGVAVATITTFHAPLIADSYHPDARMRALSAHQALAAAGSVLAPLVVALLVTDADLTWRGVFLACGAGSLALVLLALRLRDPGPGRFESGGAPVPATSRSARPGTFEIARSLLAVPTLRRVYLAYAVAGLLAGPLNAYLFFYLEDRWALDASGRGLFLAASALCTVVAAALFAAPAERLLAHGPAALIGAASRLVLVASAALAVGALAGEFGVMAAGLYATSACLALAVVAMTGVFLTLAPPEHRPQAAALAGVALTGVGGPLGLVLLGGLDESIGIGAAMALLAVPGLAAALVVRGAARTAEDDLARLRRLLAEVDQVMAARAHGHAPALLECRGLSVHYDTRVALDGLHLSVARGELVTLLGTNGAGKSTLLRAVAGLVAASDGSVRLDGDDVTWLTPERRAALGTRMVIGGRAVLAPLSVDESLRLAARAAGATSASVTDAYRAFPLLSERRAVPAGALSGGEQQMLGIAQALLVAPRLLLVDELSLGLAPAIVRSLVARVRELPAHGVTVIVADQSLEVARALGGRALFLDRGAVRFDGDVESLAGRADLLRPVLLGGHEGAASNL